MRKKNGFTLVEIVAVIGILLIIAAVAVPSVISINKRNKEKNYERIVSSVETSSENFIERYRSDIPFNEENKYYFKLNVLGALNLIKLPIRNPITNNNIDENSCIEVTQNNDGTLSYKFPADECNIENDLILQFPQGTKIDVTDIDYIDLSTYITYHSTTTPSRYLRLETDKNVNLNEYKTQEVKYTVIDLLTGDSKSQTISFVKKYADSSGANRPMLASGMIPVIYDETTDVWVKADLYEKWYDYNEQMWANAVTVTSTNRETYMSDSYTGEIPMSEINSMWVWIPRYRYKIASNLGSSSVLYYPPQIDVVFEPGTETNGVTEKVYRTGMTSDGTNTNYYTHPAFRNMENIEYGSTSSRGAWDEEITGFWAAKFEVGTTNVTCNRAGGEGNCSNVELIIKPDVVSLGYQKVSTQFGHSLKFANGTWSGTGEVTFTANENNIYGLNTTTNTTDTHMMKSTEWGAIAYLSQSQYGKMGNPDYSGTNKEIYVNNSTTGYTGRSSGKPSYEAYKPYGSYSYNNNECSSSATCTGSKTLNSGTGASTTGTIYGIYDMNGGKNEFTMGNWANTKNSVYFSTLPTQKYYDVYNGTSSQTITKAKAILGDGTWETMNWYGDKTGIVASGTPWALRGGYYQDSYPGIFYSGYNNGSADKYKSWRPVLIP